MPGVSFIPYFPQDDIDRTLGDFRIRSWRQNREALAPDENVRGFLDRYFALFRRSNGDPETRIAIVHRGDEDPFAEHQNLSSISRFTNAMMVAYLFNLPTGEQQFPYCSSDNFTGLYQRFDLNSDNPAVAFTFGSYFRMTVAGSWDYLGYVTPDFVPNMNCEPVEAVLSPLTALCASAEERVVRLFRALEWVRLTFMNYEAFPHEGRPIAMCTAFETLLDFPDQGKARYFSQQVNRLLPANILPRVRRPRIDFDDTQVGWWCRDFYDLRSKIIHGDRINGADLLTDRGVEHLRIALNIFEECIYGLLTEWGLLSIEQREREFVFRSTWREQLEVPLDAFMLQHVL